MTQEERSAYIVDCHREGITTEQQIREVLPLVAGELGNDYGAEGHIRMARYTADVRWLLGEIDRLRALIWGDQPEAIAQQQWIGPTPIYSESEDSYVCDPRDGEKVKELIDAGVLPRKDLKR